MSSEEIQIEKLHETHILGTIQSYAPNNYELMNKINEIIDYLNENRFMKLGVKYVAKRSEEDD